LHPIVGLGERLATPDAVTPITRRARAAFLPSAAEILEPVRVVPVPAEAGWREALPELTGRYVRLRELVASDAVGLHALLTAPAVVRAINEPPPTVDAFERFVATMRAGRESGAGVCFGIVPANAASAVGLIQVRQLEPTFSTAEWGFALGAPYWGTGLFVDSARLALDFIFDVLGVHRLEARAALVNGRGNGVLRKLGATQELVLRRAFRLNGDALDQALWTLLDTEWRDARLVANDVRPLH
jgi:ribosomal-protein-alanine N-acetyltransferase